MTKINGKIVSGVLALSFVCALSVPAQAQFSPNSKAPIEGFADNADYRPGVTVLTGQVDVRQADSRVLADQMKIYSGNQNAAPGAGTFDNVEKIEAIGNFYYLTPEQEVRGNMGVYEQVSNTFTVTGDVILLQGEGNIVTGESLIFNLETNEAQVVGTCKGRRCGGQGRVNILIKNSDANTETETETNAS